jgi:hypothetical protein
MSFRVGWMGWDGTAEHLRKDGIDQTYSSPLIALPMHIQDSVDAPINAFSPTVR